MHGDGGDGGIYDAEEGDDDVVWGRLKEEVVVVEAHVAKGVRVVLGLVEADHGRHAIFRLGEQCESIAMCRPRRLGTEALAA